MEIGSFFEFESKFRFNRNKKYDNLKILFSGRSIIKYYDSVFKNKKFLLPNFICSSIIDSIKNNEIIYYKINKDLSINYKDIKNKIKLNPNLLFINHYFGSFDKNLNKIKNNINLKKTILIEDFSQAFFSNINYFTKKEHNVIKFNNIRKFFGIPELSFISSKNKIFFNSKKIKEKKCFIAQYYLLFIFKKILHLLFINQPFFFKKYYDYLEKKINKIPFYAQTSFFSRFLFNHLKLNQIKKCRIENYLYLKKYIDNKKIKFIDFINLDNEEVPFYAIIESDYSKKIKEYLINNKIYPPNLWPLSNELLTKELNYIRLKLIFIPIDHRYNKRDMKKIVFLLNNWRE